MGRRPWTRPRGGDPWPCTSGSWLRRLPGARVPAMGELPTAHRIAPPTGRGRALVRLSPVPGPAAARATHPTLLPVQARTAPPRPPPPGRRRGGGDAVTHQPAGELLALSPQVRVAEQTCHGRGHGAPLLGEATPDADDVARPAHGRSLTGVRPRPAPAAEYPMTAVNVDVNVRPADVPPPPPALRSCMFSAGDAGTQAAAAATAAWSRQGGGTQAVARRAVAARRAAATQGRWHAGRWHAGRRHGNGRALQRQRVAPPEPARGSPSAALWQPAFEKRGPAPACVIPLSGATGGASPSPRSCSTPTPSPSSRPGSRRATADRASRWWPRDPQLPSCLRRDAGAGPIRGAPWARRTPSTATSSSTSERCSGGGYDRERRPD